MQPAPNWLHHPHAQIRPFSIGLHLKENGPALYPTTQVQILGIILDAFFSLFYSSPVHSSSLAPLMF